MKFLGSDITHLGTPAGCRRPPEMAREPAERPRA